MNISKRLILPLSIALAMAGTLSASGAALASAPDSFGVAAAVHGQVQMIPAGKSAPITINSGTVVSPGDQLITGASGGLQVLMTDNSVFTLGSTTHFKLKHYSYDPATYEGAMRASVSQGTYKLVTGHVSEANHGKVRIDMPTGTVTSLGTIFMGEANVDGTGEDRVVLLGPGKEKGASIDAEGSITFEPGTHALESEVETTATDEEGNETTTTTTQYTIWRAGYAVTISADGTVSEPFEMSGRDFGQMVASIARSKGGKGGEDVDGDADPDAGDDDLGDDELAENDGDDDAAENGEEDDGGRNDLDALLASQDVTKIADFEDVNGMNGNFLEEGIEMDNGGTFDFRLAFSTDGKDLSDGSGESMLDYIGFQNIDADNGAVVDGELSWDVALRAEDLGLGPADGEPTFDELDVSSEDGTLVAKGDCVGVCEGSATVLNAGQGNVAKFFILELETTDDSYEGKVVKPGGNNNFPGGI